MLRAKNRDNLYFEGMDPWEEALSAKKLALLRNSWAEIFRRHILPHMPVGQIAKHFDRTSGRPTKDIVSTCGACVLQQIFDLTDAETVDQLAFNQQWHYALDVSDQDDQVLSLKTLWNMRRLLTTDRAARAVFNDATDRLLEVYQVDRSLQRLDSVHIHSNMARLGRVRLLARVCRRFLTNLKRQHKAHYEQVAGSLKRRYEKQPEATYFGQTKPSESQRRLQDIAQDMYELIEQFKSDATIGSLYSYKQLQRVFSEQCRLKEESVEVKANRELAADSLQNPSDPDATYDSHKGTGYQVQVMETYSRKPSQEDSPSSLQLLTYVDVEPAHRHDTTAVEAALEQTDQRGWLPQELEADASYGSRENREKAAQRGVALIAPLPGKKPKNNLADFEFDATTHQVQRCPRGHRPTRIKHNKKGTLTCIWASEVCGRCPDVSSCSVRKSIYGYRLLYSPNQAYAARQRRYEQSHEFKDKYRYRAGIEATLARYVHMTGARRIRYRGLERIDYEARLKALGINIFRVAKWVFQEGGKPSYA